MSGIGFVGGPTGIVPSSGGTFSGPVTVTGELRVNGAGGTARFLKWQTAGVDSGAYIALGGSNVDLFYNAPTGGGSHTFQVNGGNVAGISAAGLAVTGVLSASNGVTASAGGVGYGAGAGGAVVQITSKATAVALNKVSGQITMNNAALAAAAVATFQVNNNQVAATDTINLNLASGQATAGTYRYWIEKVAAGSFQVSVENRSAGALAEALVFNFAVVKAVNA